MYFVGETVKNLKAEVARGAKLKCTKCGKKGAALGCYVKSCRRTYHVPCAMDISACRWDHVHLSYISIIFLFFFLFKFLFLRINLNLFDAFSGSGGLSLVVS